MALAQSVPNPEHAVLLRIKLTDDQFGTPPERNAIHDLADRLRDAIACSGVGEYDGDEFGGGQCTPYVCEPDAYRLLRRD